MTSRAPGDPSSKPTLYVLDAFRPEVVDYCEQYFDTILPSSPIRSEWRQETPYLVVRFSGLTAENIQSCPNLIALGKQGVGIDLIAATACSERGIGIFNTPGVNARAAAELVLALITSIARSVSYHESPASWSAGTEGNMPRPHLAPEAIRISRNGQL